MFGSLFCLFVSLFTTTDTISGITNIRIYNQVGNIKVTQSDLPFIQIVEHSRDSNSNVFEIRKKLRNKTLILDIRPKKSCHQCGTDILIGVDSLVNLSIEVASGNINIQTKINNLTLSVMSGNITLKGQFSKAEVEILSGNLNLNDVNVDTLSVSVSNGKVLAIFDTIVAWGQIDLLSGDLSIQHPSSQKIDAILSYKSDTIKREGKGHLNIKVTSGKLNLIPKR